MTKAVFLVFVLLLSQTAAAWTWEDHVGATQWSVKITDDETGCGGSPKTYSYDVKIQHDRQIADVGDMKHGKTQGTFDGNTLRLPARKIRDGAGSSQLHEALVEFTQDCKSFYGRYEWDYADSSMSCSGTTEVKGKRMDDVACPREQPEEEVLLETDEFKVVLKEIKSIRDVAADAEKERRYKDILKKNPQDFWANWDMAELRKKQGNAMEFFDYFDKAAGNDNVFSETREELQAEVAKDLGLPEYPTPGKSPLMRFMKDETDSWSGGLVYTEMIPQEKAADKKSLPFKLWALLDEKVGKYTRTVVDRAIQKGE